MRKGAGTVSLVPEVAGPGKIEDDPLGPYSRFYDRVGRAGWACLLRVGNAKDIMDCT